ncbi:MAG: hypothetical protein J6I64_09045 [Lachnospiraceae bacterium]|nr:hypothetical protein [Lachnospiraceae bacterium]
MKRVLTCWLIFLLLFTSTAFASESIDASDQEIERIITETMVVEPRYTYLGYMTVGLEIDENGNITYGGTARAPYYDLRITLYLQCSTNGVFWEDLEGTVKTGYDHVSVDGGRTVSEGDCFYRVKIVTDIFDSDRNIIETATGYSSEERY